MRFWKPFSAIIALVLFLAIAMNAMETEGWNEEGQGHGDEDTAMDDLVTGLFDTHVVALEVLGILLTAAMIGSLVIARPLTGPRDESNYHTPHPGAFTQTDVEEEP